MTFQALMNNLEVLYKEHLELLTISMDKKNAIIHENIDEINRLVQKENKLIKKVMQLESEREHCLQLWLADMNLTYKPEQISITVVERLIINAAEKKALKQLKDKLLQVVNTLRKQNENNQKLLKHALQYIDFSLDLINLSTEEDSTYRPSEQAGNTYSRSFFDRKG